jgi:hypothetical protein
MLPSLQLSNCSVYGICKMGHIPHVQTSHTDPPVGCHVNVVFLPHEGHLLAIEPSESKHPNLLNDVAPISRSSCTLSTRLRNLIGPENFFIQRKTTERNGTLNNNNFWTSVERM